MTTQNNSCDVSKNTDEEIRLAVLRTVPMTVFPTLDSLDDVVTLAQSKAPVISKNEVYSLLMTYHNTLLKQLEDEYQKNKSLQFLQSKQMSLF